MEAVVCVRQGCLFSPKYVRMLREMVFRHTGMALITLTDQNDAPGISLPLRAGFRGWWSKMELFAPWNRQLRPCLYFDLDTYILDDCRDLLGADGFLMLRDFFNPERSASGVMVIPRDVDHIWNAYGGEDMKGGDQAFLSRFPHGFLQDRYDGIVSYKVDVLGCRPKPKGIGRIVCFHGKPKPHECDGWAAEIWRTHTEGY